MSRQLINEYRADLDRLRQVSCGRRESVLREAFKDLLKRWGKSQDLQFIAEHAIVTPKGNRIYTDGALLHGLRVPFGYWEAKDADDKLDDEIADKFRKPKLKSYPATGNIVIDEDTQLTGVPMQAWEYRLGNRSAIDWVLDQHKEKTPRDPTIREKFNTYRFADYKESCIELLGRVVAVSVETVAVTEAMKSLDRSGWA